MMLRVFFVVLGISAFCHAETAPVFPMPAIPEIPPGENVALFPLPRLDWFQRVKTNFDNSRKVASSVKVIFDGDSITDGWQKGGQTIWMERYAKLNAFDFGIAGDRTQNLLWRLQQGQVQNMNPQLVILLIGTNNMAQNTVEEIAAAIKEIVAQYRERCPNAVILLQGIFPRGQSPQDPLRFKANQINELISKYADGKKVVYMDFGAKFLEPDGSISKEIMPDFLHPTPKGYAIWADAIQPMVDKYVNVTPAQ